MTDQAPTTPDTLTCDGCGATLTADNQFEDMTLCTSCAREAEEIIFLATRVIADGPPMDPTI